MKIDSKFSKQLSLVLDDVQHAVSHKEVADEVHVSAGQLSRMKGGTRPTDKGTRIALTSVLQSIWLNFSGARADYHVPSTMKNRTKHDDVITAIFQQRKEEDDRRKLEESFDEAITTKPEFRSPQQQSLIRDYFKEYVEEIGAENTDIVTKAEYAGIPLQDYFDKYNAEYGG